MYPYIQEEYNMSEQFRNIFESAKLDLTRKGIVRPYTRRERDISLPIRIDLLWR